MEKKRIAIIAGALAAVILIGILASRLGTGSDIQSGNTDEEVAVQTTEASALTESKGDSKVTEEKKETKDTSDKSAADTSDGSSSGSGNGGSQSGSSSGGSSDNSLRNRIWNGGGAGNNGGGSAATPTMEPTNTPTPTAPIDITFPYEVSGCDLTIRMIESYDGIFLEDGSDEEVTGITVMVLENTGNQAIEYAEIIARGTVGELTFECTDLPAGGVAVVQEKNKTAYKDGVKWRTCEAAISSLDVLEMSEDKVEVAEDESGSLVVRNISEADIPCVRVFYKFYSEEEGTYVGGITYVVKITDLAAGAETVVTPSHYAQGYSRIMMVRTYETSEG